MSYEINLIESTPSTHYSKARNLNKIISDQEFEGSTFKNGVYLKDFQQPYYITPSTISINSIEELHALLTLLSTRLTQAVIRGTPYNPNAVRIRRLSIGDDATYFDDALNWVCIDLDALELPPGITEEEIPEFCMLHFPQEFQGVSYVAQHSSQSGIGGFKTAKMHFWFLLEEGVTNEELKRWQTHNKQFDAAVFKTVQPIYTAAPTLLGKFKECPPVKERVVLVKKGTDTLKITIPEARLSASPATCTKNTPAASSPTHHSGEKFMRFIAQISTAGAHDHTKSAVASYYSKYGVNCDWNDFKQIVLDQMIAVGHPRANWDSVNLEVDQLIAWARSVIPSPHNHIPLKAFLAQQQASKNQGIDFYELTAGHYISELGINFLDDRYPYKTALIADTGTGKTAAVASQSYKRVIVFPTNLLIEQCVAEYGSTAFNGETRALVRSDFIATNYASLKRLTKELGNETKDYVLYLDEAHNMVTDIGYREDNIKDVRDSIDSWRKVIFMTATDILSSDDVFVAGHTIRVSTTRSYTQEVIPLFADDQLSAVLDLVWEAKSRGENTIIFLNNKREDGDYGRLTKLLETIPDLSITPVNADTKDSKSVQEIIIDGNATQSDVIISTCILKEGISIKRHSDVVNIIFVGEWGAIDIVQASHRMRCARHIKTYKFFPQQAANADVLFDYRWYLDTVIAGAESTARWATEQKRLAQVCNLDKLLVDVNVKNFPLIESDTGYEIDQLRASYIAYQLLKVKESANIFQMAAALSRFGIKLEMPVDPDTGQVFKDITELVVKEHNLSINESKDSELMPVVDEMLQALKLNTGLTIDSFRTRPGTGASKDKTAADGTNKDTTSSKLQKMRDRLMKEEQTLANGYLTPSRSKMALVAVKKLIALTGNLSELSLADRLNIVKAAGCQARDINLEVKRRMFKDNDKLPAIQAFLNEFTIGEKYTSDDILCKVRRHLNVINHVYVKRGDELAGEITKTKATQIVNLFFDTTRSSTRTPEGTIKSIKIEGRCK